MTGKSKFVTLFIPGILLALLVFTRLSTCATVPNKIKSIAISPDGKIIAVEYGSANKSFIYIVPVNTGNATRLTSNKIGEESFPAFSPNGKRLAYSYSPGEKPYTIAIENVDGSDLHLWPSTEINDFSPIFSPDNKTIIFARSGYYGSYSPIAQSHPHAWSFYSSDLNGTNVRELISEDLYMASPSSISPDGNNMMIVQEGINTNREIAIYSLSHAGKPIRTIQPHVPGESDHKNPILNFPNYMPDGTSILFMAASNGRFGHGYDYDIYLLDIQTGALERLTQNNGYATDLKVSVDGSTAIFLKWQSDWHGTPAKNQVYLLNIQTHKVMPLTITGLK